MKISLDAFYRLFGEGLPAAAGRTVADLARMEYGSVDDRRALLALARHVQPLRVVEFGIQDGRTARLLLDELPGIERYVGIDLPAGERPVLSGQAGEVPGAPGEQVVADARVHLVLARSERVKADALGAPLDGAAADLVYIDGGHDAATVRADSALARAILAPGGVVVWHDVGNPTVEVTGVIDELIREHGNTICGVEGTWIAFAFHRGE